MNRGKLAQAQGMQQHQRQQNRVAGEQLQEKVWDPVGFQQS
jgi:hypothetical protein